jgi:hypothetical protein
MSDQPHDLDARLRRLLGDAEPGDDELLADPDMLRLMAVLDSIEPDDRLEAPPAHLWDAIASEAGLSATGGDTSSGRGGAGGQPTGEAGVAPVVPMRRPTRPPWWLGAAAAVLVVLVVAVGALAIATGSDSPEEEVAAADLDVLLDVEAQGGARLVRAADTDGLVLVLDVAGLDPVDGYYEVWLLTPEVDGLISLGPLRSDGRYEIPDGLDPRVFSVVDVSIEPHDGDPNHSGNSILRGGLVEL